MEKRYISIFDAKPMDISGLPVEFQNELVNLNTLLVILALMDFNLVTQALAKMENEE